MPVAKRQPALFRFQPFSDKQIQVLSWWMPGVSPYAHKTALICDGSVRAGKTVAMSLSFVMWAMETFNTENLGMAGKTIAALRRNVIIPLRRMLRSRGYHVEEHLTSNSFTVYWRGRANEFYLFGGRDERSQDLIQGITLAGMFFDEVALMPESFVNQATARCSVDGAKFWFNCNPAGPYHWFKVQWLDHATEKQALHLHFTMDDNLSLSEETKARYRTMYQGVFYKRYIQGLWVVAEGSIYDMWDDRLNTFSDEDMPPGLWMSAQRYIGLDYGTQNATVFLDVLDDGQTLWFVNEYYHSGREHGRQKDDAEYADDMLRFIGDRPVRAVIVDPSAASFKVALRRRGIHTRDAENEVLDGIRRVATMMAQRRIRVHRENCPNLIREISGYVWDEKAAARGVEQPLKQNDHAVDAMRYVVKTTVRPRRLHA
ncbi:phage terminase large subunit [Alicyclobacillus hesperidum subsp. aegles]|uniref:PBSX family phage terminase large subunit n=1 Tax=Alicyclobacillus hesperidum TaxID=89784 RepID=UPI00222AD3E5|nr:PBSX family phage terminase large subunit [Alicyclobacillus hesperidum]GLG01807.1 phage terminase large subunit [Alicyclobacillus hesperidum subsp. aegles]